MGTKKLDRRSFLRLASVAGVAAVAAACKPQVVYETVEKVVKETVMVEGTPQVQRDGHGGGNSAGRREGR